MKEHEFTMSSKLTVTWIIKCSIRELFIISSYTFSNKINLA